MSEKAPRINPRLDNFKANKAEAEREQFEKGVYGDAGTTDFSDEALVRVGEADAYERHMEELAKRDASVDPMLEDLNGQPSSGYDLEQETAVAENEALSAAKEAKEAGVAAKFAADPKLRQMDLIARQIAELRSTPINTETGDRALGRVNDLEDRLNDLLDDYSRTDDYDPEIADLLMDKTVAVAENETDKDKKKIDDDSEEKPTAAKIAELSEYIRDHPDDPNTTAILERIAKMIEEIKETLARNGASEKNLDDLPLAPADFDQQQVDLVVDSLPPAPERSEEAPETGETDLEDASPVPTNEDDTTVLDGDAVLEAVAEHTRVHDFDTAHEDALIEDAKRTRDNKWYRRAWRRMNVLFTQGQSDIMDRYRGNRRSTHIALGAVAAVAVAIAVWKGASFLNEHDTDGYARGMGNALDTGDVGNTDGGQIVPGAELPPSSGYGFPWNWAEAAFGADNAMPRLEEMANKAEAAGHDVEWHGSGTRRWLEIDGVSDTSRVIDTLRQYA